MQLSMIMTCKSAIASARLSDYLTFNKALLDLLSNIDKILVMIFGRL